MVKSIEVILKAHKALYDASLQVVLSECNFGCRVTFTGKKCIFRHLDIHKEAKSNITNNFSSQYFSLEGDYKIYKINISRVAEGDYKIYKINISRVAIEAKKINTVSCKISDPCTTLIIRGEKNGKYQIKTKQNRQLNSEDINLRLKLYRLFLSKYRYTSLELVVPSAAFLADAVAKLRTDNPVRVGSSQNN